MKINQNILKQFIDTPDNVLELTNSYITEVESFGPIKDINNLVIGHVLDKKKHEDADTLSVLQIDLGNGITEQIVCGAPNVDVNQYVIIATVGAVLPGDFVIKKSKIRGVESNGMVCSLQELGIDEKLIPEDYKKGIYHFSEPKEIGSNALIHLGMEGFLMELSLTPNRSDLLSHYGYAKDLAAVLDKKIKLDEIIFKEENQKNELTVEIESKNTNSYYARYLTNITIGESPWWLKSFLLSMDCQPINNVVDITNYILYTYGIPMHAFDANKFGSKTIVVKDNNKTNTVTTLDEKERTIINGEILITNGKEAMALGGIMGLQNSMITNDTKEIILEVASFDKSTISKTSKELNLKSDSSLRFERGIDESIMMHAYNHAVSLLVTYANAKVLKGIASKEVKKYENPLIELDVADLSKKSGIDFTKEEVVSILNRLEYEINDSNKLLVKAPTFRNDINYDYDVLEEVVRIYGMDKVENKSLKVDGLGSLTNNQKTLRRLRHYLANVGFNEIVTYGLLHEDNVKQFNDLGEIVTVLKPLTVDRSSMRQSLLNGMLTTIKYNRARSMTNVNLFEIGHVYAKGIEKNNLSISLSSSLYENLWKKNETKVDFYTLSGVLNNVMDLLSIEYELVPSNNNSFHPYQQANILVKGKVVGIIGQLHPNIISKQTFVLELELDSLNESNKIKYQAISKYPNVERDIALVLKDETPLKEVLRLINQTAKKQLVDVKVFDIYKGEHIENGFKSIAIRMTFNDPNKTLEGTDVDKIVLKIVKRIEFELEGSVRK